MMVNASEEKYLNFFFFLKQEGIFLRYYIYKYLHIQWCNLLMSLNEFTIFFFLIEVASTRSNPLRFGNKDKKREKIWVSSLNQYFSYHPFERKKWAKKSSWTSRFVHHFLKIHSQYYFFQKEIFSWLESVIFLFLDVCS